MNRLVLASGSPRRSQLLRQLGLSFSIKVPQVQETRLPCEQPADLVLRLAREKNNDVRNSSSTGAVIVAADTVVVLGGEILGKPNGRSSAVAMLQRLSGKPHVVITGVHLSSPSDERSFVVETKVQFRKLSDEEVAEYWRSGEPHDKAGAYGIQGLGAIFVTGIHGSYSNVVGLPLMETARSLVELGIDPLALNAEKGSA